MLYKQRFHYPWIYWWFLVCLYYLLPNFLLTPFDLFDVSLLIFFFFCLKSILIKVTSETSWSYVPSGLRSMGSRWWFGKRSTIFRINASAVKCFKVGFTLLRLSSAPVTFITTLNKTRSAIERSDFRFHINNITVLLSIC